MQSLGGGRKKGKKRTQSAAQLSRKLRGTPKVFGKVQNRGKSNKIRPRRVGDPDAFVKAVGGHGVDPTAAANQAPEGVKENLSVQGMSEKMAVVAIISDQTIRIAAAGFVCYAIRRGWMSSIKSGEHPYYAWRYVIDVITSVLNGNAPLCQNAPKAFWDFLAALKPKSAGFKTSQVKYTWSISTTGTGDAPQFPLRSISFPYYIFWGQDSATETVNGLPLLDPPASPYTQDLGASSFSSMCDFLGTTAETQLSGDMTAESVLLRDTSAFSVCFPELGMSEGTECGVANTIYSERKINVPLLAKFATYQPTGEFYRGWQHAGKSAGSAMYVMPKLLEITSPNEMYNKASPTVKFFNFDEFFVTLANVCSKALYNYYNNMGNTGVPTCPLTVQEVQLLLRQAILSVMSNHLAMDLTLGNDFYPMTPFVVGPNGVSLDQTQMLLPTVLCENIRACVRRTVCLSKKYKTFQVDAIPVLARPASLDPIGNYTVTIDTGRPGDLPAPVTFDVFSVIPGEVPINIIDLSCIAGIVPSVRFASLQGSAFSGWIKQWNDWITSLSSVISPLTTVGAEAGISALSTIFYTVTQQDITIDLQQQPNPSQTTTANMQRKSSVKDVTTVSAPIDTGRVKLSPTVVPVKRIRQTPRKVVNYGKAPVNLVGEVATPVVPSYIDAWNEKEILGEQKTTAPVMKYIRDMILPSALSKAP